LAGTASANNAANKVTPVEKVMELMKKLSAQVTEEGKKEAAQYDKFACFCKEQADGKQYAMEKSTEIITQSTARVAKLTGEIALLSGEINTLTSTISTKETAIATAQATRDTGHAAYLVVDGNMQAAIDAIVGAIAALQGSKNNIGGDAKLDLLQIQALAMSLTGEHAAKATAALKTLDGPHAFEYQSNDIIAVLDNLKDQFLENKKELDEDEFDTNSAHERRKLGLANEAKFAKKDKDEKTTTMEGKTEEKEKTNADIREETADKNADYVFLTELTDTCSQKATDWDQRSLARAGELTALTNALAALEKGAAKQYSANKELVLVQAPSFIQIRGKGNQVLRAAASQSVQDMLAKQAILLQSPVLSMMSMKVKLAADHFVKVRNMIRDLITKLDADQASEANQKSFCDTNMASATSKRDRANAEIEVAVSAISRLTNLKTTLQSEIQDLRDEVAANLKALKEATELRDTERSENSVTVATAQEGETAVELALSILNTFYGSLIQVRTTNTFTPANAGRDGVNVADAANAAVGEVFSGSYSGNKDASTGIIGILDVILSDFERTVTTTQAEEKTSQAAFASFEKDTKSDNAAKEASVTSKESEVSDANDDLVDEGEDKDDGSVLLDDAKAELKKLKPMCIEGEETYAERVAKREKEIAALKEAMVILDDWQK